MLCKGHVFAAVVAFGAFAPFTGASAHMALTGLAPRQDNTAITKVDYYYSGEYDRGEDLNCVENPLEIPFKILGGVASLLTGVLSGAFDDDGSYYSQSFYVSPYYGSPYYRESVSYSSYYGSAYDRDRYYFDSRYGGRGAYEYRSDYSEYERSNGYDYTHYYNDAY
jgi:hypothetical protein